MTHEAKSPPVVVPSKHPAHYLMHKYWARKPHNLVAAYVAHHTNTGEVVLDPFSGSGVTAIESLRLRRVPVAVDISPISSLIIEGTASAVEDARLAECMDQVAAKVSGLASESYRTECPECGRTAKVLYCVWSASAPCPRCDSEVLALGSERRGRDYLCQQCGASTRIVSSSSAGETMVEVVYSCDACGRRRASKRPNADDVLRATKTKGPLLWQPKDDRFLANKRTLVHEDQQTAQFFTNRNFEVLCAIRSAIEEVADRDARSVLLMTFTASVAQASRLIPYRENMTTGGPAWSVPGFWVPPQHLEMNAWDAFKNRYDKTVRGRHSAREALGGVRLKKANSFDDLVAGAANALLLTQPSQDLSVIPDESVDYVFADPPYGDAVPYVEFSALWTAWIDGEFDPASEVVVSDADYRDKDLSRYEADLSAVFRECRRVLKPNGFMTVTFHNKSMDTWSAIAASLGDAGFALTSSAYCPPAVISAKAQLAPEGSMVGDVVLDLRKMPGGFVQPEATSQEMREVVLAALEKTVCERGGRASAEEMMRAAVLGLLKAGARGIDHVEYEAILASRYERVGPSWQLRPDDMQLVSAYPQIRDQAAAIMRERLGQGISDERTLFSEVLAALRDGSAPSLRLLSETYEAVLTEATPRLDFD